MCLMAKKTNLKRRKTKEAWISPVNFALFLIFTTAFLILFTHFLPGQSFIIPTKLNKKSIQNDTLTKTLEGILAYAEENQDEASVKDILGLLLNEIGDSKVKENIDQIKKETAEQIFEDEDYDETNDEITEQKIEADVESLIQRIKEAKPVISNESNLEKFTNETNQGDNILEKIDRIQRKRQRFQEMAAAKTDENLPVAKHYPKLIIIGVKKCGTGALSKFLALHPKLKYAGEIYYFKSGIMKNQVNYFCKK